MIFEMLVFSSALTSLITQEDFHTFMKIIIIQRDTCGQMEAHSEGDGGISNWNHNTKGFCMVKSQNINEYLDRTSASELNEASVTKDISSQELSKAHSSYCPYWTYDVGKTSILEFPQQAGSILTCNGEGQSLVVV